MKPTKNKIFCVSCRKPKMLFESQAKADNFIPYNEEEIKEENGKAPVRSYYCRLCCGWHVTSSLSEMTKARAERRDKEIAAEADRFAKIQEDVDSVIDDLYSRWEKAKAAIQQGRLRAAELLKKQCLDTLNSLRISAADIPLNWDKWAIHISDLQKKIARYKEFISLPKKEREALLAKEDKTKAEEEICMAYLAYQTLFKIETLLEEVEKDIERGDKDAVKEKLIECRTLVLHDINCPYKNSLKRDYRNQIKEKCNRAGVSLSEEVKRYLIDGKYMKYKDALYCLIKKFETLQPVYDSGDYYEGMWQLSIIGKGLKELPDNPETMTLRQQYDYWSELFMKIDNEIDV